ncbi:hypothetical protein H0H87_012878, partial [Tephrocybe sp. NHM501043]
PLLHALLPAVAPYEQRKAVGHQAMLVTQALQTPPLPLQFAHPAISMEEDFKIHKVWSENLKDSNTFGDEKIKTITKDKAFV